MTVRKLTHLMQLVFGLVGIIRESIHRQHLSNKNQAVFFSASCKNFYDSVTAFDERSDATFLCGSEMRKLADSIGQTMSAKILTRPVLDRFRFKGANPTLNSLIITCSN